MTQPPAKRKIYIADYSADWPALFEKERNLIQKAIGDVHIEHTGSTAIDGLGAKPVIDMMGVVHHLDDALQYVEKMEALGYKYIPELEVQIPDRRFFQKRIDDVPVCHISFTEKDNDFYTRQILFRDYLRRHPEAVREYEKIKKELAKEHVDNFDTYNTGKTAFILSIIEDAKKEMVSSGI